MTSRTKRTIMSFRKFFMVIIAGLFVFTSCDNFLGDNVGFKKLLQEEVHDSTAKVLNIKVQALPGQGNAYASTDSVKLDVSFQASFEIDSNYGVFNYWKAYANYEKENQKELTEDEIWFSKLTSLTTEVKVLKEYDDIRILPYCTKHPQLNVVMPDGLVNAGAITPNGSQIMEVGKEYNITVQTTTDFGFEGWQIYTKDGDVKNELKENEDYIATEHDPEVSESSKNLGATKATIAIRLVHSLSQSVYIEPILYEYPDVVVQFPKAYQDYPAGDVGTLTPSGTKKVRAETEYTIKLVTRPAFGFRSWRIYTVADGAEIDLFIGGKVTESGSKLINATEGEVTVSKGGSTEGAVTASIVVELLKVSETEIYIEPIVYEYPVLRIMNHHDTGETGDEIYDANAVLTPAHGTTKNIIVGDEYTVKFKTSTAYGFNGWSVYEFVSNDNGTYTKNLLVKGTDYETPVNDSDITSIGITTVNTIFSFKREFENPVYIVPDVYEYPRLFVSMGSKYSDLPAIELAKIGSISPDTGESGRAIIYGNEYRITVKTTEDHGFENWFIYKYTDVDGNKERTQLDSSLYTATSEDPVSSASGTTAVLNITFKEELRDDVWIEPGLSRYPEAYIKLSNPVAGSITPSGLQKIVVKQDYTISLQTLSEYGFSNWSFYDSTDSSRQKLTVLDYSNNDGDIPVDLDGNVADYIYITSSSNLDTTKEIVNKAALVMYNMMKDTGSSNGSVKATATIRMQKNIGFVCIEGNITTKPIINFAVPKYNGDEAGSITPLGSIRQSSDNGFSVSVRLNDLYSFDDWQLSKGSSFLDIDTYFEKKSENINQNRSEASTVFKITDGVNVDGFTISAKTKIRPQVRDTSPASGATGVVRTPAVTIVFTKPISDKFDEKDTNSRYKYFEIKSRTSMTDSNSIDVSAMFDKPEFLDEDNKTAVIFNFIDKKNDSNWLSSKGYITVTVSKDLPDTEGVKLGKDYSFSFTTGTSGDSEGPIISSTTLESGSRTLTAVSSEQAYWGDWEPNTDAESGHVYADSFRVNGSASFTATITASDDNTGDTGISGYYVIQRLMYVHKGGRLPNTSKLAESDMTLFADDGTWNGLSGCLKADYEKEIPLSDSGTGEFAISVDFKDSSNKPVDGIYMLELTAKDGLGNRSGNPTRYFVVRDTTAPNVSENAAKISFGDCGVVVGGKRYFGGNYKTAKFRFNENLTDAGTQGQPWTASKPENNKWTVGLSTSATEFIGVDGKNASTFSWSWVNATSDFEISNVCNGISADRTLYVWAKICDDFGNETAPFCLSNLPMYIDVTKPSLDFISRERVISLRDNKKILYIASDSENIGYNTSDGLIGSGIKNYKFGLSSNIQTKAKSDFSNELLQVSYSGNKNSLYEYQVRVEDYVGNIASDTFFVDKPADEEKISIEFFSVYGTSAIIQRGFESKSDADAANNDIEDSKSVAYEITTQGYSSKNLTVYFNLNQPSDIFCLKENGIWFDGFYANSITIRKPSDSSIAYENNNLNGKSYIPFEKETIKGNVYVSISGFVNPDQQSNECSFTVYAGTNACTVSEEYTLTNFDFNGPHNVTITSGASGCTVQKKSDNEFNVFYDKPDAISLSIAAEEELLCYYEFWSSSYAKSRYDNSKTSNDLSTTSGVSAVSKSQTAVYLMIEGDDNKYLSPYGGFKPISVALGSNSKKDYNIVLYDAFDNPTPVVIHLIKDSTPPEISYKSVKSGDKKGILVSFNDDESGILYFTYRDPHYLEEHFMTESELFIEPSDFGYYTFTVYNNKQLKSEFNTYIGTIYLNDYTLITESIEVFDETSTKSGFSGNGNELKTVRGISYNESEPSITTGYPTTHVRKDKPLSLIFSLDESFVTIEKMELYYPSHNNITCAPIEINDGSQQRKFALEGINLDFDGETKGHQIILRIYDDLGTKKEFALSYPYTDSDAPSITVKENGTTLSPVSAGRYKATYGKTITFNKTDDCGVYPYIVVTKNTFSSTNKNVCRWENFELASGNWTDIYFMDELGNKSSIYITTNP